MPKVITSPRVVHNENAFYSFFKTVNIDTAKTSVLNIFAQARYKLYINGKLAAAGPLKGQRIMKYLP